MASTDPSIDSTTTVSPEEASAAFAIIEAECDALPPDEVITVNVDVPTAVQIVLGAAPNIVKMRVELVTLGVDAKNIDALRTYAHGAWYAHLLTMPPTSEGSPTRPMIEEATRMRERFLRNAEVLADDGLLDAGQVAAVRSGQGHVDLAGDVVASSAMFKSAWPLIAGKTPITLEQIEHAQKLGTRLMDALGARTQPNGESSINPPSDRRARAFTLLVNAYDACRRGVSFLRWSAGDADVIAPSLYTKFRRTARAAAAEPAPPAPPPPPAPAQPV